MKQRKITINDAGNVYVPDNVLMSLDEIAVLFDIYPQTVKGIIKAILKSNIISMDNSKGMTLYQNMIIPDSCGLEMIIAVAFRIHSHKADVFRKWIIEKITQKSNPITMILRLTDNTILN